MKVILIGLLFPIAIIYSCASQKAENKKNQQIAKEKELFDTLDAMTYIGYVNKYYFQKTDEFYVELYFKNLNTDNKKYEQIVGTQDSIIFQDDENRRSRIPNQIAKKEFDFTGLRTITLFDENHRRLTDAQFVRVEYLDQNISPVFTAVYIADKPDLTEKAKYCVGNLTDKFILNAYTLFEDTLLTKEISQKMGYRPEYTLAGKHYRENDKQTSISIINIDDTAIIVEKENNKYYCLYKSNEPENIVDVVFVPIVRNGRSIILLNCMKPESDVEWNSLLVYDGKIYIPVKRQRLKK